MSTWDSAIDMGALQDAGFTSAEAESYKAARLKTGNDHTAAECALAARYYRALSARNPGDRLIRVTAIAWKSRLRRITGEG